MSAIRVARLANGMCSRFVLALDDTQAPPAIAGAVCFEYYIACNCSLVTYIITAEDYRGIGLSRLSVAESP
jgi:hypothetical protein